MITTLQGLLSSSARAKHRVGVASKATPAYSPMANETVISAPIRGNISGPSIVSGTKIDEATTGFQTKKV